MGSGRRSAVPDSPSWTDTTWASAACCHFWARTTMNDAPSSIPSARTGEGNQVWFVTAGGALFAAWPLVYATVFSGFYYAMLAVLWALFFRPVGFDYRSKVANVRWRTAWDWGIFVGSAVPALVFGVAFGNIILYVPFHFEESMPLRYSAVSGHCSARSPCSLVS